MVPKAQFGVTVASRKHLNELKYRLYSAFSMNGSYFIGLGDLIKRAFKNINSKIQPST